MHFLYLHKGGLYCLYKLHKLNEGITAVIKNWNNTCDEIDVMSWPVPTFPTTWSRTFPYSSHHPEQVFRSGVSQRYSRSIILTPDPNPDCPKDLWALNLFTFDNSNISQFTILCFYLEQLNAVYKICKSFNLEHTKDVLSLVPKYSEFIDFIYSRAQRIRIKTNLN